MAACHSVYVWQQHGSSNCLLLHMCAAHMFVLQGTVLIKNAEELENYAK
jgi:hypothetical protein